MTTWMNAHVEFPTPRTLAPPKPRTKKRSARPPSAPSNAAPRAAARVPLRLLTAGQTTALFHLALGQDPKPTPPIVTPPRVYSFPVPELESPPRGLIPTVPDFNEDVRYRPGPDQPGVTGATYGLAEGPSLLGASLSEGPAGVPALIAAVEARLAAVMEEQRELRALLTSLEHAAGCGGTVLFLKS
eukprot:RCo041179